VIVSVTSISPTRFKSSVRSAQKLAGVSGVSVTLLGYSERSVSLLALGTLFSSVTRQLPMVFSRGGMTRLLEKTPFSNEKLKRVLGWTARPGRRRVETVFCIL
jgi:hypothetical protein